MTLATSSKTMNRLESKTMIDFKDEPRTLRMAISFFFNVVVNEISPTIPSDAMKRITIENVDNRFRNFSSFSYNILSR